ncbi:MAG: helix-turn-helix domain-containing protein [Clostridia bacterium]|nr:helix-turn-helix domain-containing protein [Clostridia bacterium]
MEGRDLRLYRDEYLGRGAHIRAELREASSFPLHSHEYFEMEIVLEGSGTQWLNGKEYRLERGSVYFLTPADFHRMEISHRMRIWNVSFDEAVLSPTAQALWTKAFCRQVDQPTVEKLDAVCRLLEQEQANEERSRPLVEYFMRIAVPMEEGTLPEDSIHRAMRYVQTYFREDPSLSEVAAQVCLSPGYFGNLFKQVTGTTYVEYLNTCKVNCAMMLLENGVSVSGACFDSGFGSLSGFLYAFRQRTGISPKEYRKACQRSRF